MAPTRRELERPDAPNRSFAILKRADGSGHQGHEDHDDHKEKPVGAFAIVVNLVIFVAAAVSSFQCL